MLLPSPARIGARHAGPALRRVTTSDTI
jgi:hypothetical protein